MEVAHHLEAVFDHLRVELDPGKDRGVGSKVDRRAAAPRGADLLQRANRLALLEAHLPLRAVALDGGDQLFRQRVDDAGADAVQAAGGLVVAVLELAAGMQHGEDHFERAARPRSRQARQAGSIDSRAGERTRGVREQGLMGRPDEHGK